MTIEKYELHVYYNKQIITKHKITNKLLNIKSEHDLVYEIKAKDSIDKKWRKQ